MKQKVLKNNDKDQEGNFKDIENPKENNSINNIITKKELTEKNLKDNKLENLEEPNKSKINKFMLIYDMKTVLTDNSIKWPVNLIYGTKKYYLMNKKKDIVNINHNILNQYCINHRYKSKVIKNVKKCNSKIQYKKKEDEFYLIENHLAECQININIKKNILKENSINAYKLSNFSNEMHEYLNKNPLNNYKFFKKYAEEKLIKLNLNIITNENFFKNIYYPLIYALNGIQYF